MQDLTNEININDIEQPTQDELKLFDEVEEEVYQEQTEEVNTEEQPPTLAPTPTEDTNINDALNTGLNVNRVVTENTDTNVKTYTEDEVSKLKLELEEKIRAEQTKISLLEEQNLDSAINNETNESILKRLEAQGRINGMSLKQYLDYIQEGVLYNSSRERNLPIDNVRRDYERYLNENDKFSKIGNAYKNNIGQTFKQKYNLNDFQVKHYLKDAQVAFGTGLEEIESDVIEAYLKGKFSLNERQKESTRIQERLNKRIQTTPPRPAVVKRPVVKQPVAPKPINFAFEAAKSTYEQFLSQGDTPEEAKAKLRQVPAWRGVFK